MLRKVARQQALQLRDLVQKVALSGIVPLLYREKDHGDGVEIIG